MGGVINNFESDKLPAEILEWTGTLIGHVCLCVWMSSLIFGDMTQCLGTGQGQGGSRFSKTDPCFLILPPCLMSDQPQYDQQGLM